MRGNLQHEIQIALAHVQVAFAGAEFRAQRQFAPQAFQGGLHQLTHGLQGARLGQLAGQARNQADDPQQLDMLAADGKGVHGAIGIERAHETGEFRGIRECNRNGVLDEVGFIRQIPFVRGPHQVGEAVVHHHAAQAGHEHPKQPAIRLERSVRGGRLDGGRLDFQQCSHPSGFGVGNSHINVLELRPSQR